MLNARGWRRMMLVVSTVAAIMLPTNISAAGASSPSSYFINNQSSSCSNSGPGTDRGRPWCDFTPLQHRTFGPGDIIRLARGSTWDQELVLTGSGAPGHSLVLGAYGNGPRPRIIRDGHNGVGDLQRAVLLTNPSYVAVDSIEVGDAEVGIEAYYTTPGHQDLEFHDIATHSIHGIHEANMGSVYPPDPTCNGIDSHTYPGIYVSSGVVITGPPPSFGADQSYVTGISVDGLTGTHNQATFSTEFCNGVDAPDGGAWPLARDVAIRDMHLQNDDGDGVAPGCADGLHLVDTVHARVLDSTLIREAACHTRAGTAAVIVVRSAGVIMANNAIESVPDTGSSDQIGVDLEYNLSDIRVLDNYLGRNAGSGLTIQNFRAGDHMTDLAIADNVFDHNAVAPSGPWDVGGILLNGAAFVPTGTIVGNLYDEPSGFLGGTAPTGFVLSNNQAAGGAQLIRRTVGRDWTAPANGHISIRARAFSLANDHRLTITVNDRAIWHGAATPGDWSGSNAALDDISVRAGDRLEFHVTGEAHDSVSWAPLIAFTAGPS